MEDDLDWSYDQAEDTAVPENSFNDLRAKQSHEELRSALADADQQPLTAAGVNSLLDAWFEANYEGFCIRDFDTIIEIVDIFLALPCRQEVFGSFLASFLKVCRRPIMELTANERLSARGGDRVLRFFSKLASLMAFCSVTEKIEVGYCFHCICNGYRDPHVLRCDWVDWVSDPYRLKVVDKVLLQKFIRTSSALSVITAEFVNAADYLRYDSNDDLGGASVSLELKGSSTSTEEKAVVVAEEEEEEVDYYTIVEPATSSNPTDGLPSPTKRDEKSILREFSQTMLDLCLDLSEDYKNGVEMCMLQLCDGAITMLHKDFSFNASDARISFIIELVWNVLEAYQEKNAAQWVDRPFLDSGFTELVLDFERAVAVLKAILGHQLKHGFRLSDKELRNEVVIVLATISQFPGSYSSFVQSGLFNLLLTYSCVEEMGLGSWFFFDKPVANTRNFGTVSDIDLEFKKELWFTVAELVKTKDPDILLCFASSPMLECMLLYLEENSLVAQGAEQNKKTHHGESGEGGNNNTYFDRSTVPLANFTSIALEIDLQDGMEEEKSQVDQSHGGMSTGMQSSKSGNQMGRTAQKAVKTFFNTLPQYKLREFQLVAITFVVHVAPAVLAEFERIHAQARILDLILRYNQSEAAEHKAIVLQSLILMNKVLVTSLTVRKFMEESDAVNTFLYIFGTATGMETKAQAVRLVSALCSNHNQMTQGQLKDHNGISDIIAPLRRYAETRKPEVGVKAGLKIDESNNSATTEVQDPLENPYGGDISILVIALLDCLGKGVVGNAENEAEFADREGVDELLNLLEISPFVLRIQILRLISDILNNRMLVTYVNAWKSPKTFRSACQMLCHCWLDEEMRLSAERKEAEKGVICDIWNPLANHVWPVQDINYNQEGNCASAVHSNFDAGGNPSGVESPSLDLNRSVTVMRLATAILAGRNATETNLPTDICDLVLKKDTRVIISSALESMGVFEVYEIKDERNPHKLDPASASAADSDNDVDGGGRGGGGGNQIASSTFKSSLLNSRDHDATMNNTFVPGMEMPLILSSNDIGLTPADRQVLAMARKYHSLREGELWQQVQDLTMGPGGPMPIEADVMLLKKQMERSFDAAQAVLMEQMELLDEDVGLKKKTEAKFMKVIVTKMEQQIKTEWLKRRSNGKRTL